MPEGLHLKIGGRRKDVIHAHPIRRRLQDVAKQYEYPHAEKGQADQGEDAGYLQA
jgi:hypothetical protein